MAKEHKDNKGRVLRKGESQRKEDNRYMYTCTGPDGQRRRIYANTLVELRKKEDELKRDQVDGLDIYVAGNATLNFVFDRYIMTKVELRETTRSNYTYMYDHFVRDNFGKKKIAEIKYSDVMFFYQKLQRQGMRVNTIDNIHSILHPTFQLAVRDNIIRSNPSDGVMAALKKNMKKNTGVRHALTIEQQQAFLGYVKNSEYESWAPLFTVLLGTGCRIGECVGLRWCDIDYEKRTISINHSITYYSRREDRKGKSEYAVSLPKTDAGIRTIPMLDEVMEAFQDEYEKQKMIGFNETEIDGMTGFIFQNRFGGVHNPSGVNRAIRRISESYNEREVIKAKREKREPVLLPHFSCHHLRHTFCTRFCENESNIKVIQAVMGHANIETTMDIYAEATESKKQESMRNLAEKMKLF